MSINKWDSKDIEDEIIHYLNTGKQVFLTSGAANDCIISYSEKKYKRNAWQLYTEREITFVTSACIFPETLVLTTFDEVRTEEWNGSLFVHVS